MRQEAIAFRHNASYYRSGLYDNVWLVSVIGELKKKKGGS